MIDNHLNIMQDKRFFNLKKFRVLYIVAVYLDKFIGVAKSSEALIQTMIVLRRH